MRLRSFALLFVAAFGLMGMKYFAGQGAPVLLRADQETERCNALVVLQWTDTNSQTIVRTDVRRRGIRADSTVGGAARDTLWTVRGYTSGKPDSVNATLRARGRFRDGQVTLGRTYRYQLRDSISGAALTGWSDSVSITLVNGCRAS